jgi:MoaA/NifB/PqqE/SkfB family radical SAM enzyme
MPPTSSNRAGGLAQLGSLERVQAFSAWVRNRIRRGVISLTLEVTRRCNARCDFCDHWREPKQREDLDCVDVVRRLDPLVVVFCGGEPLLRRSIVEEVRAVAALPGWRYNVLITNGWLLDRDLGLRLREAGLQQINVSLNWPDERQSEERRLRGLFERIERTVPALCREGIEVNLNTMVMKENLEELTRIAGLARQWGAKVGYTLYSEYCNGNSSHQIGPDELPRFREVVEELIELKGRHRHITNNAFYLRSCIPFLSGQRIPGCPGGKSMVHVSPQGMVKPCADLPPIEHYTSFDPARFQGVTCDICWMACRGEVQAPVDLARIRELLGV